MHKWNDKNHWEIDTTTGAPTAEYVMLMEDPAFRAGNLDKVGDAVWLGDGKMNVIIRDSSVEASAKKYIFEIDITHATDVLSRDFDLLAQYGLVMGIASVIASPLIVRISSGLGKAPRGPLRGVRWLPQPRWTDRQPGQGGCFGRLR